MLEKPLKKQSNGQSFSLKKVLGRRAKIQIFKSALVVSFIFKTARPVKLLER